MPSPGVSRSTPLSTSAYPGATVPACVATLGRSGWTARGWKAPADAPADVDAGVDTGVLLVSLVAMLSGLLNARSRFAPGAFVPVLLNILLIAGVVSGYYWRQDSGSDVSVAYALAIALSAGTTTRFGTMNTCVM